MCFCLYSFLLLCVSLFFFCILLFVYLCCSIIIISVFRSLFPSLFMYLCLYIFLGFLLSFLLCVFLSFFLSSMSSFLHLFLPSFLDCSFLFFCVAFFPRLSASSCLTRSCQRIASIVKLSGLFVGFPSIALGLFLACHSLIVAMAFSE